LDLREPLAVARADAIATVRWAAALRVPPVAGQWPFLALVHPTHYPLEAGDVASSAGARFASADWGDHVEETQRQQSTALFARLDGESPYLTGPLARWALNQPVLPAAVRAVAAECGLEWPCRNPFRSIVVRAVELLFACDEALRLIEAYDPPADAFVEVDPRGGQGRATTEAPRGALHHRYAIDDDGLIESATIVPPTSQNQAAIEADLRSVAGANTASDDDELRRLCEQAVRNHDPCISCATHFLDVTVDRV
ncbi:MAG: nickel-dependent hydrogenase large subunit, partial [Pseudomonadota bacterium]